MHCLALTWKIIFLIVAWRSLSESCGKVPPPSLLGAYPSFFCSLIGIGIVTVAGDLSSASVNRVSEVINDAASLLGCSVGMADDLTAITLVALGTSLPVSCRANRAAGTPFRDKERFALQAFIGSWCS